MTLEGKLTIKEAVGQHQSGDLDGALESYRKILKSNPQNYDALHLSGVIHHQKGEHSKAIELIKKSIEIMPEHDYFYSNLALAQQAEGLLDDAQGSIEKGISIKSNNPESYYNLANIFRLKGEFEHAIANYGRAITLNNQHFLAYLNMGNSYKELGDYANSLKSYSMVLKINPNHIDVYINIGNVLSAQNNFEAAIGAYEKIIAAKPDYYQVLNNIGLAYSNLGQMERAEEYFNKALSFDSSYVDALGNLANICRSQNKFAQARDNYIKALEVEPKNIDILNGLVLTLKDCCDWQHLNRYSKELVDLSEQAIKQGLPCYTSPFNLLSLPVSNKQQQEITIAYSKASFGNLEALQRSLNYQFVKEQKKKLNIGYMSANFRNHPTSHLMSGMLAMHERENFKIFTYSVGPNDNSQYRKDIENSSDIFRDFEKVPSVECAKQIYQDKIDILINIMGHTVLSRNDIFALKPAPIQYSFLTYAGTMGADFIDYFVTDQVVVPEGDAKFYSEKLIYMPDTYFVTNPKQTIACTIPSKQECSLPEDKFVFCCFSKSYKLTAELFDAWATILTKAENSVLWLFSEAPETESNLRSYMQSKSIDSDRLIFAKRLPKDQHLARHKHADLFVDSFIYNAHTTAIDALLCDVPVVTLLGDRLGSRASASILEALGVPELVSNSVEQYIEKILYYYDNPKYLDELKKEINNKKHNSPLFGTQKYVTNIEKAFKESWKRYINDEDNNNIIVEDL